MLLAHGAGSGPWVFDSWHASFLDISTDAVDLQAGLDVAMASHDDYADLVVEAARRLPEPVALCGWSMGGLVVLQAAQRVRPHTVVLIEASPPGEVQGFSPNVELGYRTFDPEVVYGRFPSGIRPS